MKEIKEFRKKQGWTQKKIAEYLEIPTITYIQWENGTRNAPQYVLNLIKYKLRTDTKQISIFKNRYLIEIIHEETETIIYSLTATEEEYKNFEKNYWYVEYIENNMKGYKVKYNIIKEII